MVIRMKEVFFRAVEISVAAFVMVAVVACAQPTLETEVSEKSSNENSAENFLEKAAERAAKKAENGDADAQFSAGNFYMFAENYSQAALWFRKAAEQGHADAQHRLGGLYFSGHGVQKDVVESTKWLLAAAQQGHGQAQSDLALVFRLFGEKDASAYWDSKAKEQHIRFWSNKSEGVRWFRERAERGDAHAQYNLCYAYSDEDEDYYDPFESVRWCRKAAEQGHASALSNLGWKHLFGLGVIQDTYEAYIWLSLAEAFGGDSPDDIESGIGDYRLSRAEIRAAKREAAQRLEAIERRKKNQSEQVLGNMEFSAAPKETDAATRVFENAWRSVVVITSGEGQGSGVVVRPNIVATNCHLVSGDKIAVYKSVNRKADTSTPLSASIRHADKGKDFCLLDVAGLWGVPVQVRKYDSLKVGESVYGLGAPQGLDLSISLGLISQLRTHDGNRYIQTDAAISPGSSGGGLFDSAGNLIGILTAKITDEGVEGIGFAIPADLVSGI